MMASRCFRPLDRLLAAVCQLSPARTQAPAPAYHIDPLGCWQALVERAQNQGLGPLLAHKLSHPEPPAQALQQRWGALPPQLASLLAQESQRTWIRAQVQLRAVEHFHRQCLKQGLPYVLLKGMSYLPLFYPDPSLRPMFDLDLLVPPRGLDGATEILRSMGFEELVHPHPNDRVFHHRHKQLFVDLHGHMSWPGMTQISTAQILETAVELPHMRIAGPVERLLLHIHNQGKKQLLPGFVSVRSFLELRELLLTLDSRQKILPLAQQWGMQRFVQSSFYCLQDLYPDWLFQPNPPAPWWQQRLVQQLRKEAPVDALPRVLQRSAFLLAHLESWPQRLRYLRSRLEYPFRFRRPSEPS